VPNIFLVDDNQLMRQQALRFLEQQDSFTISGEAVNGKEAISKFPDLLPDITIMDFEMPEMNGLEATAAIRAWDHARYAHTPIIAMTAHAMAGDREKAMEVGCEDYDTKPVEISRLLGKIAALLAPKMA